MAPLRLLPPRQSNRPASVDARAIDNLRFIRDVMERSTAFIAISGWGQVMAGVMALAAAAIAGRQPNEEAWLLTWLGAAVLALLVAGTMSVHKALVRRIGLFTAPGRRFMLSFIPPLAAGALLTFVFYRAGLVDYLPALWLLTFGAGVIAGGAFSVRIVPLMGLLFMVLGVIATLSPAAWGDLFMALGFGGLHIVFGVLIARRYGG